MVLNVSEPAGNAVLNLISDMAGGGAIELLDDGDDLLATLPLSDPAAGPAVDGEIMFNEIDAGIAATAGTAASARIVGADGTEVLTCDVGDLSSDAVIRLNTVQVEAGKSVAITSFTLRMP